MPCGNYGYDAPNVLITFASLTVASGLGVAFLWWHSPSEARSLTVSFLFLLAATAIFLHTTKRGKFQEWERILNQLQLTGAEIVLDIGCGRGAVLTAVGRRLTTGSVTGIDIWNSADQSGNAKETTLRNAALEGVSDRVLIETADMRCLPFPDATFHLVVSSLAIHNISSNSDRKRAVAEAFRVTKAGGRIVIADIRATGLYAATLRDLGASKVELHRLGWRFWWGNPFAGTKLLTASK